MRHLHKNKCLFKICYSLNILGRVVYVIIKYNGKHPTIKASTTQASSEHK
ncbi:hypothetical protein ERO13_D03G055933v2 [Gossypium hirsutum]|uniref:Uncharacterized protein n=3 Tax=Gossypium TaxID=3633 RepID=A0A0D2NTL2_GOSRA|nr:hypothetical protein ES319_D03G059900v1 [Gossypium barbadense]KAG4154413.1 hypothetical protein ERO13_D03G055933v2 [Gossypium hirsutum]KJB17258.1 hypothetical protein B456_003G058800 [Gossypium raimondii]KJB17259.1 hypothetical protein B456_003G058800 [Gossypium raimondii]TYI89525.1 hypothetical protein E1A91_D03G062000v1 [Gossypium mustelinum]